jgi:hypothetical protein
VALLFDGARQSPRGERESPVDIFGPFGKAERLNRLNGEKGVQKDLSQRLISPHVQECRFSSGMLSGQLPRASSDQALCEQDRQSPKAGSRIVLRKEG